VDALTRLSGDAQTFLGKVWASRVHLHRTDHADLVGLLSLDDVDHLLTSTAIRTPSVRVAQDGAVLASSRFTRSGSIAGQPLSGLVDPRKALALFDGGATVVLQGLHRYWPPLIDLVRDLELQLGHPCQANAYLTPPGAQGFARHSDTHDVFVFQTHGRKQWEVVDVWDSDPDQPDPVREVLLEPGLSMYLPTGTPHSARSQDEVSLHVTLGINRVLWRDLLGDLAAEVLTAEEYAEPVPPGYVDDPHLLADALRTRLDSLTTRLSGLRPETVAEERAASYLRHRPPLVRGALLDLERLPRLHAGTTVARRRHATVTLADAGDRLLVHLGDRALRMPGYLRPALEHVATHATLSVGDLPLDEQSALVLVRRLVREGLLQVVEDSP
jgi:bifunctional lysine-specific demethylase and histidyl-hydroxylase NO66